MHSERTLRATLAAGIVGSAMGLFVGAYAWHQQYEALLETAVEAGLLLGGIAFAAATVAWDLGGERDGR